MNPRIIEEKDLGDYTRQRVVYTIMESLDMISYVLIPKMQVISSLLSLHAMDMDMGVRK